MTEAFVKTSEGHRLFVRDWGSGSPVVLLAGWGMHSGIWGSTMVGLNARGLRTIAYDRRGHGRSSDPGYVDYDTLADDLARVLDKLDLRDITLVAHSGAAGEALRMVTRHGSTRLRSLVFVGAAGPRMIASDDNPAAFPREVVEAVLDQFACDLPRWIDENAEPFAPGAGDRTLRWLGQMVLDTSRRILIDFQRVIAEADLRAETANLLVPLTVIHGDIDASAPLDITGRCFASLAPVSDLRVYKGAAHGLMLTHTAKLVADIADCAAHERP